MKLHIYNKSGFSHTCALDQLNTQANKRIPFSTGKKIKILRVIKKMVEEESLTYSEASSALGLDQSMISRWKKKEDVFVAIPKADAFYLHSGPTSILFIDTWRSKGLPVNCAALMRKVRSLIPHLETKSEHVVKMSISRFMMKHVTVAVTVTASGRRVKQMVVFNGECK